MHTIKRKPSATQGLDEELVASIGLDVLRALEYMHSRGRIHRDVKVRQSYCCVALELLRMTVIQRLD